MKKIIIGGTIALCAHLALADEQSLPASTPAPDKSQYTLFNPTPIGRVKPTAHLRSTPAFSKSRVMSRIGRWIMRTVFALAPGSPAIPISNLA